MINVNFDCLLARVTYREEALNDALRSEDLNHKLLMTIFVYLFTSISFDFFSIMSAFRLNHDHDCS